MKNTIQRNYGADERHALIRGTELHDGDDVDLPSAVVGALLASCWWVVVGCALAAGAGL